MKLKESWVKFHGIKNISGSNEVGRDFFASMQMISASFQVFESLQELKSSL